MINNTAKDANNIFSEVINKENILKKSRHERLKYLDDLTVTYPLMDKIIKAIEECKNSISHSSQPECLSIVGPPRVGKTRIIETFMQKYPNQLTEDGINKTILYCEVPCPATINGLVSSLLQALGDPFYNKTTRIIQKSLRLEGMLSKCNVKMIILDEVQHLIDSNRRRLIIDSSDWFKVLIAKTKIPVVFVGLDYSTQIFIENKQLGSRVLNRFTMKPFKYSDKSFRAILYRLDRFLPLESESNLSKPGIWEYIYIATLGHFGYLKILLKESVKIALDSNYSHITMPILAQAFDNKLIHIIEKNPFLPGFNIQKALSKIY